MYATTTLNYDLADNLTNIVNANEENIWYAYNQVGDLVATADPYLGQWTYQRDYDGRLRKQTDAREDVIELSYVNTSGYQDPLGRVQSKQVYNSAGTLFSTATYLYDSSPDSHYTVYKGQLYEVTDSEGSETNSYDTRGRPAKTTRYLNINAGNYTTSYTYNDGNYITSIAYPNSGPTIDYSYYTGGSISSVYQGTHDYYSVGAANYDVFGHVLYFTYGNGVATTRNYYGLSDRLESVSSSVFNRTFFNIQ